MYPIMLNVRMRPCLVVGGGGVALRKLEALLINDAQVTVVAPEPIASVEKLADAGFIRIKRRHYRPGEAALYSLVIAATDDREINRRVYEEAENARVLVNVADEPSLCSFHLPARVQRGSLQLAIASNGKAPFAVRRLRQMLERRFDHAWSEWMEAAKRFRRSVLRLELERTEQEACFDRFFDATVNQSNLTSRVPSAREEQSFLDPGDGSPHRTAIAAGDDQVSAGSRRLLGSRVGLVSLVGGGPGDPGLLTLRARQRLLEADAVVFDRLAATALPCDLPARIELHGVGKTAGYHPIPQEEINAMVIRLAREGKRVVRLKGGDPFVFGRGGEEAEELKAAGIPFEIVPGITAAVAVPAYAGVPVTHRRESVRATLVTAHEAVKENGAQVRWDLLAADPNASLLGYMGVKSLTKVVAQLLAAGMDPQTPAAMVSRGTTSAQVVVQAVVSELPAAVAAAELKPPALFIIGPTVRHAADLNWFGNRPLHGQRLVIAGSGEGLGAKLELAGAELVPVPLMVTPAARVVMGALPVSGCVFRNKEEVDALDEERQRLGWGAEIVAWCLDSETADRARCLGWQTIEEFDGPTAENDLIAALLSIPSMSEEPVGCAAT